MFRGHDEGVEVVEVEVQWPDEIPSEELALRSTARELVQAFMEAEIELRAAFRQIVAAQERLNKAFGSEDSIKICASYGNDDDFTNPARTLERMGRSAWKIIVDRLEIQRWLSIKRWTALEKRLDYEALPAITEENLLAFGHSYQLDMPTLLQEATIELFDWLRPEPSRWEASYKTNEKNARLELGPRIILTGIARGGHQRRPGGWSMSHHVSQHFRALENIFQALDKKGQVNKSWRSAVENEVCSDSFTGVGETAYFGFRCFHNGNMHFRFLRPDLLALFNQRAGGLNLRPAPADAGPPPPPAQPPRPGRSRRPRT